MAVSATPVASSPKVNFCMEGDTLVGGVPNTPATTSPSVSNCTNPNGLYGLSVGWGDQYSFDDAGNNIDISNLPDGTYWLRAQADPYGYFAQQGPDQSVTDTQLQITGTTVKVLQQVTPAVSRPGGHDDQPDRRAPSWPVPRRCRPPSPTRPPSPACSSSSTARRSGAPVTTGGPTYSLAVSSLPPGQHMISAQAVDSNYLTGTAPVVNVSTPTSVGNILIDQQVHATGSGSATTRRILDVGRR